MGVMDRVRAHARTTEVRQIVVPEWGDETGPLVVFHTPVTLGDLEAARSGADGKPNGDMRANAELVCLKACDKDGRALFRRIDALALMSEADPVVVLRVAGMMTSGPTPESAAKN